jgi:probable F420-dependent oxidoreductase
MSPVDVPVTGSEPIRFFVRLPHSWCGASVDGVVRVAEAAEALGFDGVSVQDRLLSSRGTSPCGHRHAGDDRMVLGPLATLAFVAARTARLRLLTGVIVLPFHHVVRLAKEAGTVDVLSNGRLILGVGIGWPKARSSDATQRMSLHAELAARETALFDLPGLRWKVMDEALEALDRLWRDDSATYHGETIAFDEVDLRPKPVQQPRPPIWIGGRAEPVLRRVARYGEAWFPSQASVDVLATGRSRVLELAAEAGRPAPAFGVNLFVAVDRDGTVARDIVRDGLGHRFRDEQALRESTIAGSPAEVVDRIAAYVRAGCRAFDLKILPLATAETLDQVELLAREVLPAFRA